MALVFRDAVCPPLPQFSASVPDAAIVGLLGAAGSGIAEILRLAAGVLKPREGAVDGPSQRCFVPVSGGPLLETAGVVAVEYALDVVDPVERFRLHRSLEEARRRGASVLVATHNLDLLKDFDEAWWIEEGRLRLKADPSEVATAYLREAARRIRELGQGASPRLDPSLRAGDGRAELISIQTLDESGAPVSVWQSGETAVIRVRVQFHKAVEDPVIGIMIRTRVGLEVYGTNTELEGVKLGPCQAGDIREVEFRFRCELCPREYTLTAASHDPDGVWHDWMEDALAFSVADTRYTAGVANLRAKVSARALT